MSKTSDNYHMRTIVFIPSGDDVLKKDGALSIDDLCKLVRLHNLIGKKKDIDQGALLRHAFDGMSQGMQKNDKVITQK